eukprot:UN32713
MEWFGEFVDLIFVAAIYNIVVNIKYQVHDALLTEDKDWGKVAFVFWEAAVVFLHYMLSIWSI